MKQQDILRQRILRALLSSPRLTRAELLERIPVRPATLYDAIRRLDREGLVDEPERSGVKTGRKASPIMLHPKAGRFVGVELDVADTLAVLIDASGEVLAETRVHSKSPKDVEAGKREIRATLTDLRKKAKASDWRGLKGVGFADPGLVDVKRGISLRAVNIPGWECFPTRDWLQKETGLPAAVFPAISARAYADSLVKGVQGVGSLFHMQIDTGVGGGFVRDGDLLFGDASCGMEIGHVVVQPDGALCRCGNRGCLEALAGADGIRRRVQELVHTGVRTRLTEHPFSLDWLVRCIQEKDKVAGALAMEIAEKVGVGLATIVALLNPSEIVLSGTLPERLPDLFLSTARRVLALRCFPMSLENLRIRVSDLPEHGNALGAALLARKRVLLPDSARMAF